MGGVLSMKGDGGSSGGLTVGRRVLRLRCGTSVEGFLCAGVPVGELDEEGEEGTVVAGIGPDPFEHPFEGLGELVIVFEEVVGRCLASKLLGSEFPRGGFGVFVVLRLLGVREVPEA